MNLKTTKLFNRSQILFCMLLMMLTGCQYLSVKKETPTYILKPIWVTDTLVQKNIGFRKVNLFTPILYKDSVIVANALEGLVSYNRSNRFVNWRMKSEFGIEASGVTQGDTLFVGGLNGVMYAVNMTNGKVIWSYDSKAEIVAEPSLHNNSLYFLNGGNSLFSLNAGTGKLNWVYSRQETTTKMTVRGGSRPSFAEGSLYAGFSDGALVSLNSMTGTVQWEVQLNNNSRFKDIDASPVVDGETVYINSYDDKLYAISKANGSILWKSALGGASAPVVSGDKLYYSASTEQFVCLNKKTGELIWKKDTKGLASEPILLKDFVIFGESAGSLKALDLNTGSTVSSFDPGRGIMSQPSSDHAKSIFFISGEANFYQVDLVPQYKSQIPYLIN